MRQSSPDPLEQLQASQPSRITRSQLVTLHQNPERLSRFLPYVIQAFHSLLQQRTDGLVQHSLGEQRWRRAGEVRQDERDTRNAGDADP